MAMMMTCPPLNSDLGADVVAPDVVTPDVGVFQADDAGAPDFAVARVENDTVKSRYVAFNAAGVEMGWLGYRSEKGVLVIWTTRTMPEFRGHGVADALTRKAADDAVAAGTPIDPICWYASEWMHHNPKYLKYVTDPGF